MKYRAWTKAEKDYVLENAHQLTDREIAANLSKMAGDRPFTKKMVKEQRQRMLKLKKKMGHPNVSAVVRYPDGYERSEHQPEAVEQSDRSEEKVEIRVRTELEQKMRLVLRYGFLADEV